MAAIYVLTRSADAAVITTTSRPIQSLLLLLFESDRF